MSPPNVDDIYALTPMQRLMLLHSVTNPARAVLANQAHTQLSPRREW